MLIVVLILGVSLANMSLQGEKASRGDRDRQVAINAAEAALKDAELDIDPQGAISANSRNSNFDGVSTVAFAADCNPGNSTIGQGLCLTGNSAQPIWQTVNLSDDSANSASVAFGRFTGQTMVTGIGSFPNKVPRYIIEPIVDKIPISTADLGQAEYSNDTKGGKKYMYRITAVGFGANPTTQVVLQSVYRKAIQ